MINCKSGGKLFSFFYLVNRRLHAITIHCIVYHLDLLGLKALDFIQYTSLGTKLNNDVYIKLNIVLYE